MGKSASSQAWLKRQMSDEFVKRAKLDGYVNRAAYKLEELDIKDDLIKKQMNIVDLGASPGGFSQYASRQMQTGTIFALDLLPISAYDKIEFIQGDFRDEAVLKQLKDKIGDKKIDLIISDMSPNLSGIKSVDIPASMYLVELAIAFADDFLKPNGDIVTKIFQGEGFDKILKTLRDKYKKVASRKPKSSRAKSNEIYLVCKNKNP